MFRQLDRLDSPAMGRPMHLWRFGHYGPPLLVFPSSAGLAHEWETGGVVSALQSYLEAGRLKLYCTESNASEAWMGNGHPFERIKLHQAFESYVVDELVPLIRDDCRSTSIPVAVAGVSLGAFYSALFSCKHPDLFRYALCLSGKYDATWLTQGLHNDDIYYNNPVAFVSNLEGEALETVRQSVHIDLVCGQGPWEGTNPISTRHFASILRKKSISHRRELWGDDAAHSWSWWVRQAMFYLGGRLARGDSLC